MNPRAQRTRLIVNRIIIFGAVLTLAIVAYSTVRNVYFLSRTFQVQEARSEQGYRLYTDTVEYMNYNDSVMLTVYMTRPPNSNQAAPGPMVRVAQCAISAPAFDTTAVDQSDAGKCQWVILSKYAGSQVIAVRLTHNCSNETMRLPCPPSKQIVMRSFAWIKVGDQPFSLEHLSGIAAVVTALVALYFRFFGHGEGEPAGGE